MDYLSLCLICKDENDYLPEWLDYHILMGVDRFYIYDNVSRISLREALQDYIERGWVVVVDIPGSKVQLYAYDHCLRTFGARTFWMGFIDTDEFLVLKTDPDLKEFLRGYEAYAGLAVSSLFFGSNGHKTPPVDGQISSYVKRTHSAFEDNRFIKSIVQPKFIQLPNSPHDFVYKAGAWCVNENRVRVDDQQFPHQSEKIQLNHYFCRSQEEIEAKLKRGGGARSHALTRGRFDAINAHSDVEDKTILEVLQRMFDRAQNDLGAPSNSSGRLTLLSKLRALAETRRPAPFELAIPDLPIQRPELMEWITLKTESEAASVVHDVEQYGRILLKQLTRQPAHIPLYVGLSYNYLSLNDPVASWQALSQAWQTAPNSYIVLIGMCNYFLATKNFSMAEKTSRLLQTIAPQALLPMGFLAESLIGQGRYEDALKIGVPVVELAAMVGELPKGMGNYLVKLMADYLLKKKDFDGAVKLWEAGAKCQLGKEALIELSRALLLADNASEARRRLLQAQAFAPHDERVGALLVQANAEISASRRNQKKK